MKKRLPTLSKIRKLYFDTVYSPFPDIILWISFALLLIIHCIENTSVIYSGSVWVQGMYLFRNFLYLLMLIRIGFFSLYGSSEIVCAGIFLLSGFCSFLCSRDFGLFELFIVMFAVKDLHPRRLVKTFAIIKGTATIATLLLWRIGVLSAVYYQDDTAGYYNTYGFCHRNVLGANIAVLCLVWFYLRFRKLKIMDAVLWIAIAVATYKLAVSRTSFIIILVIIFAAFSVRLWEQKLMTMMKLRTAVMLGFGALLLISIIGTLFFSQDSMMWRVIDSIFTKRFRYAHYCLQQYGLSLFGKNIAFISSIESQNSGTEKLILDNAYMRAILYYGLIPGILFLGTYLKALSFSIRKKDFPLLTGLAVFAVYGMSERYMLDVYYQFPLVVAWCRYFFRTEGEKIQKKKVPAEYVRDVILFCKRIRQ